MLSPYTTLTADNTVIHKFSCSAKSRWQRHSKPLKGVGNLKRVTNFGIFWTFCSTVLLRQDSAPIALPLCIALWLSSSIMAALHYYSPVALNTEFIPYPNKPNTRIFEGALPLSLVYEDNDLPISVVMFVGGGQASPLQGVY